MGFPFRVYGASNSICFSIHFHDINFLWGCGDRSPMMSSFVAIKYWFFSKRSLWDKYQCRSDIHLVCVKNCRITFWLLHFLSQHYRVHYGRARGKRRGGAQEPEENVNCRLPRIQERAKQKVIITKKQFIRWKK